MPRQARRLVEEAFGYRRSTAALPSLDENGLKPRGFEHAHRSPSYLGVVVLHKGVVEEHNLFRPRSFLPSTEPLAEGLACQRGNGTLGRNTQLCLQPARRSAEEQVG